MVDFFRKYSFLFMYLWGDNIITPSESFANKKIPQISLGYPLDKPEFL
jgi:hypothetical protein